MRRAALTLSLLFASGTAAADTTACEPIVLDALSPVYLDAAGTGIPLGGLELHGVEPDEIDFRSACTPTVSIPGLELRGVEPDEIDNALAAELLAGTPRTQTREHVLLARDVRPLATTTTSSSLVKTKGRAVLALDSIVLRTEVVSLRPYQERVVADLELSVVGAWVPDPALVPVRLFLGDSTQLSLVPAKAGCPPCYVGD